MNLCVEKRFLSLLLAFVIVMALLPWSTVEVSAAANSNTPTTYSYSANLNSDSSDGSANNYGYDYVCGEGSDTLTIWGDCNHTEGDCGTNWYPNTTQLTLTNNTGSAKKITFTVTRRQDVDSFEIGDKTLNANTRSHELELDNGSSVVLKIEPESGKIAELVLEIVIQESALVKTTFIPVENVSYTVAYGTTIETVTYGGSDLIRENAKAVKYTMTATPGTGYKFIGWYNETTGAYISNEKAYTTQFDVDYTIKPVVVPSATAVFKVGSEYFTDLGDANTAAVSGSNKTIVLFSDGTLPAGDYEISSGVTLLIPCDDANTVYTTKPATVTASSPVKPTIYRTLTMAAGANLVVNGSLSIGGSMLASTPRPGSVYGSVGRIHMASDSHITVNNGAKLYAWGFITGAGDVTAKNGATVYEDFQVADFLGGDNTSNVAGNKYGVFPFTHYYIQNIEVPLKLEAGAIENGYMAVYVTLVGTQGSEVPFIGPNGMFNVTSGYVVKDYDETTGRLVIDVYGEMDMKHLSISMKLGAFGSTTIKSQEYQLPVTSNLTVRANNGSSIQVTQNLNLLPGSQMYVEEGANITLGSGNFIVLYDEDDWVTVGLAHIKYHPAFYTVGGTNYTDAAYQTVKGDAFVYVEGTLDASDGAVYTTSGGAAITAAEGATIKLTPGNKTETYQVQVGGSDNKTRTYVAIPITPAKLKNADGTYTETAGADPGTTYVYCSECNKWAVVETLAGKAPTCTETGLTEGMKCSGGHVIKEQEVVPAKGHSYNYDCDKKCNVCGQETRPGATCVSDAEYDCVAGKCKYCSKDMPAITDHTYDNECDADCNVCSATRTPSDHVPGAEATCTTAQICTVCEEIIEKALGHKDGDDDGDCTTAIKCTVCQTVTTEAKAHVFGEASYDWVWDADSNTYVCTASRTCQNCEKGKETLTEDAPAPTVTPGTCTTEEVMTYTVQFDEEWAGEKSHPVSGKIDPDNHAYDETKDESNLTRPVLVDDVWQDGYYTFTCENDPSHTKTEKVERADYSAFAEAEQDLRGLLDLDLTDEAIEAIKAALVKAENIANNLIKTEQDILDTATEKLTETYEEYHQAFKSYTVTFVVNGETVKTETVFSGNDATAPEKDPTKEPDETYHYTFSGWDNDFKEIKADTTVTAQFTATPHTFTHTDKDDIYHTDACECGYSADVEHRFDDANDTDCNICDYTREARIGDKSYATLAEAIAAADEDDTIVLLKQIVVGDGQDVTIEGNVTIETTVDDAFAANAGGKLTLVGVTVKSNTAILWANGGTIEVDGATLSSTGSKYAVAFAEKNGHINVNSGTIEAIGCTSVTVSAKNATVNISGGEILNNTTSAVSAKDKAVIEISGGNVKTTATSDFYCSAYAGSGATIKVTGGTVTTATTYAVVAVANGKVEVSGGTINGGVIAHENANASANISGGVINGDVSARNGAVVTVSGGSFIEDVTEYCVDGFHTVKAEEYYVYGAHVYGTAWTSDETNHWHECACGAKSDEAAHSDETTKDHKCDTCEYEMSECSDSDDADHKCDHCGKDEITDHVYGTEWKSDEINHWHECACGAKSDEAAHSDETTKDHKCDTCEYEMSECSDSDDADHKCDHCGKDEITDHVFGSEWKTNTEKHWHECACGAKSDEAAHSDETTKDHKCDTCEYEMSECSDSDDADHKCDHCGKDEITDHVFGSEWKTNTENHWHECACGAKSDEAAHSDETTKDHKCDICGKENVTDHSHSTYSYDIEHHWSVCVCGKTVNGTAAEHEFVNGACVCGLKEIKVIKNIDSIKCEVDGRVVTVTHSVACKAGYLNENGEYVALTAEKNEDGSYSFTAPVEAVKVLITVKGDANGDGRVTAADIARINAYIKKTIELTAAEIFAGDIDCDGVLKGEDIKELKNDILRIATVQW